MQLTKLTKKRVNELLKTYDFYIDEQSLELISKDSKSKGGALGGLFNKKIHKKYITANLTKPNEKVRKEPKT